MKLWAATGQRLRGIAWVLVGGSVVFAGIATGRAFGTAGPDALTLPLALLASAGVIAAALLTGWYPVRPIAQGLAVFGALVHLLVLLRSGPIWTRGCSAVLAVTHTYALVMLFVLSAREADDDGDPPLPPTPRVGDPSTPSRQSQHTESAVSASIPAQTHPVAEPEPDPVPPPVPDTAPEHEPEPEPVAESSTEEREPVESAVGGAAEQRPASTEENK